MIGKSRIALAPIVLLAWGCFTVPAAPVQFSCDQEQSPACPEGYSCLADGCCHRDDEDEEGSSGACRLGEGAETGETDGTDVTSGTDESASSTDPSPATVAARHHRGAP